MFTYFAVVISCTITVFRYLRTEHLEHCVPSNVSSGLAGLPVDYVYTNLTADRKRLTTKKLPTGEPLDGKESYRKLVSYFTTTDITPEEIQNLGNEMLHKLYPEVRLEGNETMVLSCNKLNCPVSLGTIMFLIQSARGLPGGRRKA